MNISVTSEPDNNLTLIELEKFLKEQVKINEKEAQKRTDNLKILRIKESDLCTQLGEEPMHIPHSRVPSKEILDNLSKVIKTLELELEHRQKNFKCLKAAILARMQELEMKPSSSLERDLLVDSDELIVLSKENLAKMKSLSKELQQKVR